MCEMCLAVLLEGDRVEIRGGNGDRVELTKDRIIRRVSRVELRMEEAKRLKEKADSLMDDTVVIVKKRHKGKEEVAVAG